MCVCVRSVVVGGHAVMLVAGDGGGGGCGHWWWWWFWCVCVFLCAGCCVGCALAGVIGEWHARTWRTKVSIKPLLVQMHKVRQSVLVVLVAKAPRPAYTHCAINVAGLLLAASSRHWSIVNPIEEFSCLKISFAVIEFLQSSAFECRCVASICSIFSQGKEISGPLSLVGGVVCGHVSCVNNASLYSYVWVVFLIMLPLKCAQNMRVCVCVCHCVLCVGMLPCMGVLLICIPF